MDSQAAEALRVRQPNPSLVSYVGTREQLLAAGVVDPRMFPEAPRRRRWSRDLSQYREIAPDCWSVTAMKEGLWRVTRETDFDDPVAVRARYEQWLAEDDDLICGLLNERITRDFPKAPECSLIPAQSSSAPPATADAYRRRLVSMVEAVRPVLAELMAGKGQSGGFRLTSDCAELVLEQLAEAAQEISEADVVRAGRPTSTRTPNPATVASERSPALSDAALAVAEGWTMLPALVQRHVQLVINDYIASQCPGLRPLYAAATLADQERAERLLYQGATARRGRGAR